MEKLNLRNQLPKNPNLNLKNAVNISVHERDGAPVLVVKDAHLNLEFHADLPHNYHLLPAEKQDYWFNKELQVIARKILSSVKNRSY